MSSMDPTSSVECGSDVPTLANCTQESGALSNDTASTQQSAISIGLTVSALVVTTALLVVLVGWISYRVRKRWERQQREIEEAEAAAEAAARKAGKEFCFDDARYTCLLDASALPVECFPLICFPLPGPERLR